MKIKIDTPHYKLYSLSYTLWNRMPPEQTNLCQYVRRLAFAPVSLFFIAIFLAFVYSSSVLRAVFVYPFGYTTNWRDGTLNFRSPGLLQVKGFHLYPGYILAPIALVALNYFIFTHFPTTHSNGLIFSEAIAIFLSVIEGALLIVGLFVVAVIFFTSDTYDLITEYWDAKTEGACPLVEFEENDHGNQ